MEFLTLLAPALIDGVRGLITRWTGGAGAQPANVEEVIQIQQADTERLKALAELDQVSGDTSKWVNNIRAMQRPTAVAALLLTYGGVIYFEQPAEVVNQVASFAEMAVFYLFGERGYRYIKRGK